MDQDTAPDKRQPDVYWDAENIRIVNNGRNLSVKPIKESAILVPASILPEGFTGYHVVGNIEVNNTLYLFVTNNTSTSLNSFLVKTDPNRIINSALSKCWIDSEYNLAYPVKCLFSSNSNNSHNLTASRLSKFNT